MSKLNFFTKKIYKVVLGVIVFLCAGFVVNTDVFAISASIKSENDHWVNGDTYIEVKASAIVVCFGNSSENHSLRLACKNGSSYSYIYDDGATLTGNNSTCSTSYANRFTNVQGKINLTANLDKLAMGLNDCNVEGYISFDSFGNSKWKSLTTNDPDMDIDFVKLKAEIKNILVSSNKVSSMNVNVNFNDDRWENGETYVIIQNTSNNTVNQRKVTLPSNPTLSGYTFIGYADTANDCTNSSNIKVAGFTESIPANNKDTNYVKTYYACWEKTNSTNTTTTTTTKPTTTTTKTTTTTTKTTTTASKSFVVIFDGNGGKTSDGKTQIPITCTGSCTSFPGIDEFANSGQEFIGWSTSKSCTNASNVTKVTSATTYYACWKSSSTSSFTVEFNQGRGSGLVCESGYTSGSGKCTKTVNSGTTIKLPDSDSYDSYNQNNVFMGWTSTVSNNTAVCTNDTIQAAGTEVTVKANTTYYPCYREDINATRYARANASADGQTVDCGAALYITECVLTTAGEKICTYNKNGNKSVTGTVYRNLMAKDETLGHCTSTNVETVNAYKYGTISSIIDTKFECGAKLYITTCSNNICNFTSYQNVGGEVVKANGTVNKQYLKDTQSDALNDTNYCPKVEIDSDEVLVQTKCNNTVSKNVKGTMTKSMCYSKTYEDQDVKDMILENNLVICGSGYEYDKTATRASGEALCNDNICVRNYTITCKQTVNEGSVSVRTTSAIAGSDGYGIVKVQAYVENGSVVAYYLSEEYNTPTSKSEWTTLNSSTFEIKSTPGVQYIWIKDSNGNISNVATVAVFDNTNTSTTLKVLQLTDGNNNTIVPNSVSYTTTNNGYTLLTNYVEQKTLTAQGFDSFKHEYKLEVDSPTLSVYATLTSSDSSYVDGYGPRTVNLKYGDNTILIKVKDNNGNIRTYTIIATRKDDRSSDNTLNDIQVSVGNIEFNSNVTEYKIEIPANTTSLDVTSIINSELASYVEGYEPGNVLITGDTTVKLIKVQSETGSIRTYVLSFVKEQTDVITKESLQLSGLTIPGTNIPFESSIANYNISVDYTDDVIDLYTPLKNSNSIIVISVKKANDTEYSVVSNLGINLDVGENYIEIKVIDETGEEAYYRLTIIRKEFGLEVSNDTTLKDLKVLGYNIKFDPTDKEYTVKIKTEKTLVITAVPNSNRAEVFIRGNDELTGFSTVRVKVVAENGEYETYSIDIQKDAFNKTIEIIALVVGCVIIIVTGCIIIKKKKIKNKRDYYRE